MKLEASYCSGRKRHLKEKLAALMSCSIHSYFLVPDGGIRVICHLAAKLTGHLYTATMMLGSCKMGTVAA